MSERERELWLLPGKSAIQGRRVARYEARHRSGTFGCFDVFVHFEDGTEALYMRQVTGRGAKDLARGYNRFVERVRKKELKPNAAP